MPITSVGPMGSGVGGAQRTVLPGPLLSEGFSWGHITRADVPCPGGIRDRQATGGAGAGTGAGGAAQAELVGK